MKNINVLIIIIAVLLLACKTETNSSKTDKNTSVEPLKITPVKHGTFVIEFKEQVVYIDPTGGAEAFNKFKNPSLVLITDIHGDHFNLKTLEALDLNKAALIAPKAVADKIPANLISNINVLNNNESAQINDVKIEAIPMYNLGEDALKFHEKGRGNGYVITINDKRIYISGDTEDIPEMRQLKNIDKAFVCMNLPYTMTVESAASAVLEFKPKTVYPYHYRGTDGFSDVGKFKSLVNAENNEIKVELLKWY